MNGTVSIGLIGDYNPKVAAHPAIPMALHRAARNSSVELRCQWVPTVEVTTAARVSNYDGLWCVPGSPYRNMDGALLAIRHARETQTPFLGTCGGFQHAIVEFARNVLGWADADHAESSPDAARPVIVALECALVQATRSIHLFPGTRLAAAYGATQASETYWCRFGLNPEFQAELIRGPLHACADDELGAVRAIELGDHPFFVATLFQPERAALEERAAPLAEAFLRACAGL
jgi:CTP synthase (UTP-ammonia lyase)